MKVSLLERVMTKIEKQQNGCWLWTAFKDKVSGRNLILRASNGGRDCRACNLAAAKRYQARQRNAA